MIIMFYQFGRKRIDSYAASEKHKHDQIQTEEDTDEEGLPNIDSQSDTSQESEGAGGEFVHWIFF